MGLYYLLKPSSPSDIRFFNQLLGKQLPANDISFDVLDASVVECMRILIVGVHAVPRSKGTNVARELCVRELWSGCS